ncbi:MAG: hypothetical protein IPG89_11685 [Bacteroidetes bacterium]|nr:hypothetical protein [Bacteroidota bacterium]
MVLLPFCTGTTYNFPAPVSGTEAEVGPDYGCFGTQPNPVWYYLQIASNGTIVMDIAGADAFWTILILHVGDLLHLQQEVVLAV